MGRSIAVGFTEDVIELQFGSLSGSGTGSFGSSVLALIAFDDPLGVDPFASLFDGNSLGATITISSVASNVTAPVPLPASPMFLMGGLVALGAIGGKQRRV